ncbi:MAG: intradiol ring-cleavage dioxygenase, partial [candidate division NC10 bacterium]|nr:intradiol ring-cleavage dioxygenase [candidate division NC10 bacterium]
MTMTHWSCTRRGFLGRLAVGAVAFSMPGAFAEALVRTPRQTEGPFYPNRLPLDTDNDLLVINDAITPAVGEITHLSGKILDARGEPVRNGVVEIWQVDKHGAYLHPVSA